jgi:hypothetical protein
MKKENDVYNSGKPIKIFTFELNFSRQDNPVRPMYPSMAHEWADLDPVEYFELHRDFGVNAFFTYAYTFGGYAFYPTKLGPVAPGQGQNFIPHLYELCKEANMPFWSYFCVGTDVMASAIHDEWVVPQSRSDGYGFFAPETPWTDLLCARIREFLSMYPADWILFDWFFYGCWKPGSPVMPAWFVEKPFEQIIGRPMPKTAEEITPEESLKYKRKVLADQFYRIRDTVKETSPNTKIMFNVPYGQPAEPLWVDHPMINESDGLFAECSKAEIVDWLLSIKKPKQRVMTTIIGHTYEGWCEPESWKKWIAKGCDLFAYAGGVPPKLAIEPNSVNGVELVRKAFLAIP